MRFLPTPIPGVIGVEPDVHRDARGFFLETYNAGHFRHIGIDGDFVQDNHSQSRGGVLRGLHYQEPNAQGKLVRCSRGAAASFGDNTGRDTGHSIPMSGSFHAMA